VSVLVEWLTCHIDPAVPWDDSDRRGVFLGVAAVAAERRESHMMDPRRIFKHTGAAFKHTQSTVGNGIASADYNGASASPPSLPCIDRAGGVFQDDGQNCPVAVLGASWTATGRRSARLHGRV
jgi:hypothetical protein